MSSQSDRKAALALSAVAGFIGGLCCLTPVVLVLFGLTTVSFANSFGNLLYGEYRWGFRLAAVLLLAAALTVYFRRRGICTLAAARRERNRIVNLALLTLAGGTAVYVFWTYVVLHYWGIAMGLPWAQWDEGWALPVSAALFAAALPLGWWLTRAGAGKGR